jgi:hypothetical protein
MSAFHTLELGCVCGHQFPHHVARGVNAQRSPQFRQQILDGTFHTVQCPSCTQTRIIETAFSYIDPKRNLFIQVKPRKAFFDWKIASRMLEEKVKRLPAQGKLKKPKMRVVFGLAELREKILCETQNLDDRTLELIKVVLLYEHPMLMKRPRLQFVLTSASKEELVFRASHLHDKRTYKIVLPVVQLKRFKAEESKIISMLSSAMSGNNMFDDAGGHYMSYLRWMPQTDALAKLAAFSKDIRAGRKVQMKSKEFQHMLRTLPRGSHLTTDAKNDLKRLQQYALRHYPDVQEELWEVRFGKDLESEFWKNDNQTDINILWKVFEELPDNHIENNNMITEVELGTGGGGTYDPTNGEIEIGIAELPHHARLEDTVRHEVGHGVHEKNHKKVQQWLKERFGWQIFEFTPAGMDKWVRELNGWGNATAKDKRDAFRCFREAFDGKDEWSQGNVRESHLPKGHIWHREGFLPRKVYEKSPGDWFNYCKSWYRSGNRAFFLNYYYETMCIVNVETIRLIAQMPSRYAAMSDHEFFAELYALHFDKKDPRRKAIPADVKKWLNAL